MPRIRQYAENYAAEDFRREMRSRMGYHDLSQSDLAGKTVPRTPMLKKLASLYGCTTDELLREPEKAAEVSE